jgi:amino acid adenylation domain-containing protein
MLKESMSARSTGSRDIVARFRERVRTCGPSLAVEFDCGRWSYQELDRYSELIARLIQAHGAPGDCVVVIDCGRSPLLVAATLACLKAGMVFFVVGEHQPDSYVARALAAVSALVWLGAQGQSDRDKARRIAADRVLGCVLLHQFDVAGSEAEEVVAQEPGLQTCGSGAADRERAMYLVATSGTTGRPKLVATGAVPVENFIDWYQRTFALAAEDKFSMLSGLGYDPMIRDIFTPLSLGASVSIPSKSSLGSRRGLREWINDTRVSVVHATPQLAQVIFAADGRHQPLEFVRVVAIGGAVLTQVLARQIKAQLSRGSLVNVYGTSETPQVMTYHVVQEPKANASVLAGPAIVPIGRPITEVNVQIINERGQPSGESEVGEIHITTPHLSTGYYQDPELTRERFTFSERDGCRSYRTGDLGFVDSEGNLHFVGRRDRQVKHRGYRIQLEEIERAIMGLDGVVAAAVMTDDCAGAEQLVCYVQFGREMELGVSGLKQQLVGTLPTYMLPDRYVVVDSIPLTNSNKIDYSVLRQTPLRAEGAHLLHPATPATDDHITVQLLAIWAEVLGTTPAAILLDSQFFDVGGTSLLAVRLIERVNEIFPRTLVLTDLFVYSSIREMSGYLAGGTGPKARAPQASSRTGGAIARAERLSRVSLDRGAKVRKEP